MTCQTLIAVKIRKYTVISQYHQLKFNTVCFHLELFIFPSQKLEQATISNDNIPLPDLL